MTLFNLNNYLIHDKAIKSLTKWLDDFDKAVPDTPKAAIIYGPSGSGKTTLVNSVIHHMGYDNIEFVPDYNKTHKLEIKRLDHMLNGNNIKMMINFSKKAILFDDIDIGSSSDRGFISDIIPLLNSKKKKKNHNPLILTINNKISNKKTAIINKYSLVINIDRLTDNEIYKIGKQLLINLGKQDLIDDIELRLISNTCQGDIRNITQKIEGYNEKEYNGKKVDITNIYSYKDLEIKCLPTLEKYCNPDNKVDIFNYYNLYFNDPLFIPAFIYENSFKVINNVSVKKKKKIGYYHKILNSLTNWCIFNNHFFHYNHDYNVYNGVIIPLNYIRTYRQKYKWTNSSFNTSNLYSRISQSSFNNRSLCELSHQLGINQSEYHLFTYILYQLLILNESNITNIIIKYFIDKNITSTTFDRLFRYNCLSNIIEHHFTSKKKSYIRKFLHSKLESNS
jgi:GTPase SAR1 family protein